jgi:NADH-quinone oxidoreductase subunit N
MFYSNLSALVERSVPRIVAFSSVSHAAFMISAMLVSSSEKIMLLYAASYTVSAVLLIGLLASYAKGPELELEDLYAVARMNPLSSFALALAIFSLAGIPPFPLFFAKFYLLKELISSGFIGFALFGAIFSAVAAGYYLRMARYAFLVDGKDARKTHPGSFPAFPVSLNAVAVLLFVFYLSYFFKILPPQ